MTVSLALFGWAGAILGFGFLVCMHELGHFLALKSANLPVHAFSIGFGNPWWTKRYNGTEYRIGWIPLGGYVMSEDPVEVERREAAGKAIFPAQSALSQFWVAVMGPVANLVLAFLLFSVIIWGWGEPRPVPRVESPVKGSPAFLAGLLPGDRIIRLNQVSINTWQQLIDQVQEIGLKPSHLEVERQGSTLLLPITPVREGDRFVLGIRPAMEPVASPDFSSAIQVAAARTIGETMTVVYALKRFFTFSGAANMSGPVAILGIASDAARGGVVAFLTLLAILSVNLAVFNLLPIPPLDGLRIVVAFWQLVAGKPPRESLLVPIYQWGALGLAVLFLLVTLKDLGAFFL